MTHEERNAQLQARYAQLRVETIGNVTVLTGPAGCGKTHYAYKEAFALASGPKKGNVVVTPAGELEYDGMDGRINPDCVKILAARNSVVIIEDCSPNQIEYLSRFCSGPPCQFFLIQRA